MSAHGSKSPGVVQSRLQPELLSLCFADVHNHTPHVPQQFCPSRLWAPQFRPWLACQPTVLPAVPSPVPQAAGDAELRSQPVSQCCLWASSGNLKPLSLGEKNKYFDLT